MRYKAAKGGGERGKCTNIPLQCGIPGCKETIWKYNAPSHLFFAHAKNGKLPDIPPGFMIDIFI
jgi:hypothetical protein